MGEPYNFYQIHWRALRSSLQPRGPGCNPAGCNPVHPASKRAHRGGERVHGRHVPSENTLDGQHAPMEAHLVHQIALPEYVGSNAHLAVRRGTPLL